MEGIEPPTVSQGISLALLTTELHLHLFVDYSRVELQILCCDPLEWWLYGDSALSLSYNPYVVTVRIELTLYLRTHLIRVVPKPFNHVTILSALEAFSDCSEATNRTIILF